VDLRKRKSQEKLQNALALHLQNKTLDQITIGELTKTAGVSRQTFYSNFDSKQSILLSRIETMLETASHYYANVHTRQDISRNDAVAAGVKCLLTECDKQRVLMRAAFSGQAGIQSLSLLKSYLSRFIAERILLLFNYNFTANELDVISDFYAGAYIGVIQGWLLDDTNTKSIDEVSKYAGLLMPHGLDGMLGKTV